VAILFLSGYFFDFSSAHRSNSLTRASISSTSIAFVVWFKMLSAATWGAEGYAREELVAEIGAGFLCAELGITPEVRQDHADYLGHCSPFWPTRNAPPITSTACSSKK
jgi:antirestriction protein ArdC